MIMTALLYVIAGQSNAVGGAHVNDLGTNYSGYTATYASVTQVIKVASVASPAWEDTAAASLAPRGGIRLGVELSMGRDLDAKYPGRVKILKMAVSSAGLNDHYLPSAAALSGHSDNLYTETVAEIIAQETALTARFAGFIWIQGNDDAGTSAKASAYAANMRTLHSALAASLPGRNFRFVFDQLPSFVDAPYTSTVRSQQATIALDPRFTMLTTDSYKGRDTDHYDAPSFIELGRAFARAL